MVDRQFLLDREEMGNNTDSELIPSINLTLENSDDNDDGNLSFESNGSQPMLVGNNINTSVQTSTPIRGQVDLLIPASPICPPLSLPEISETDCSNCSFEYMAESRNRPRRVVYTDEETNSNPDLPVGWTNARLLCVKYVDDCLAIEKLNYKDAGRVEETMGNYVAFARACKTQEHF